MKSLLVLTLSLAMLVPVGALGQSPFSHSWPDLFILNVDGSGETRLTNDLKSEGGPKWWTNGKRIVFSGQHGLQDIYVVNSDGTEQTNLTNTPDISEVSPTWSPDGRYIAYSDWRQDGSSDIMVMNADGSNPVALTTQPDATTTKNYAPAWSPDGKQIAFVSDRLNGLPEVFLMDTSGANVQNLTDYPDPKTFCMNPAWSPNGKQIAFSKHFGYQQADIYVMNADGSNSVALSDYPGVEESPTWSPDGQWIAFSATIDRSHQIFRIRADGTGAEDLTGPSDLYNAAPSWSQDGKQIVFWSTRPPEPQDTPPTNKYIIWDEGGLSIDLLSDEGAEFRYGVRNADGTTTITPLTAEEASALIKLRGMEKLFRP